MMKQLTLVAVMTGLMAGASMTTVLSAPAAAREAFSFSFDTGSVAFAYSDGYWDHNRQWHKWRNAREAREYRARFHHNYYHHKHTRDRNMGWRGDQDRDGVPNRYDRDRDGDGTPNRFDDRPNNPRRD
jgi:hypothetical protein